MIVLIGASASGKTEISKILISNYQFKKMITYTTRDLRKNEVNHVDYHFVSKTEFIAKQKNHEFLETSLYNGNLYGTAFRDAELNRVLIVEPEGANNIYNKHLPCTFFFYLEVPSEIRKARMLSRGDHISDIEQRILMDESRFKIENLSHVDFILDTSSKSLEELSQIIFEKYEQLLLSEDCKKRKSS